MDQQGKQPFAEWTILELMGHRRLAGYVQEVEIAGKGYLRIDIPSEPPVTQIYGPDAIYCMTPTTEEIARGLAKSVHLAPVSRYELPAAATPSPMCDTCERDINPGETGVVYLGSNRFRCAACQERFDGQNEPEDISDTPECSCGEPTCLGTCGQPPVQS
jgi:hypothetical protein